jgi:predicted nucleotidyltransferase
MRKKGRIGSSFDKFLREEDLYEEVTARAIKRVIARQLGVRVGLTEALRRALEPYSNKIKAAFVYGSVAKGSDTAQSDIDVMVIGDQLSYSDLFSALQDAESLLQRKVSPLFLSVKDWTRKASQKESFANKIKVQPKLFIFGSERDIGRDGSADSRDSPPS